MALSADDPDGQSVTWSALGLPDGLTIDTVTGTISGTLGFETSGLHTIDVTVEDPEGAVDTISFDWTITNTNREPTLTPIPDQRNSEGNTVNLTLAATDPDGQTVTFAATGLPTGLSIDTDGLISGSIPFTTAGTWLPTITVNGSDGDNEPLTWTATGLPDGVTIDETNGEIPARSASRPQAFAR